MFKKIIIIVVLLLASQPILAQKAKPAPIISPQNLDVKIQNEIVNFTGKVWIYAKNLDT